MSNSGKMQLGKSSQWLPPGWMVEVKERPSGSTDRVYIDPVSGLRFRSKREALRYLGLMEPSTPKKRDGSNVTGVVEFTKRSTAIIRLVQDGSLDDSLDWLPFNWQVELTERRNGRVDRYYVHPVTGFKFRSKKEVSRYLQNGEMPKERHKTRVDDAGRKFFLPSLRQVRKLARSGTRRSLFTERRSNTSKVENNKRVLKLSEVYASEHCWKDVGMQCYNVSELGQLLSNIGDSGDRHTDHACASKQYIVALSAPQKRKEPNCVEKSRNKKLKTCSQETENESVHRVPPCRTSRRLAGLDPELPAGMGKDKQLLLTEPMAEMESDTEPMAEMESDKEIHSPGGEEQPNELEKIFEEGTPAADELEKIFEEGIPLADFKMKLVSEKPESKVTQPRAEGNTIKYVPCLGGEEKPNDLGETFDSKDPPADYPLKLASKRPETEITTPGIEVHPHSSEEKSNEAKKTTEHKDVAMDCQVKITCKGPETETSGSEVETEKVMHSLGSQEQPYELRTTPRDKDATGAYLMKLAFKESKSETTMPRVEMDREKDMHFVGAEEKQIELGETYEGKVSPTDYAIDFTFDVPQAEFTLPFEEPSEFTLLFGEPSLDPCLEFAYKTLTGIIPIENLPIKNFLPNHVSSVSTQDTGCLKWQDIHGMANLSLD